MQLFQHCVVLDPARKALVCCTCTQTPSQTLNHENNGYKLTYYFDIIWWIQVEKCGCTFKKSDISNITIKKQMFNNKKL